MNFTPQGSLSLALARVAWCIATCPSWHTWTGVDPTFPVEERFAESLKRVHITTPQSPAGGKDGYTQQELIALRPYAVVSQLPPASVPPARETFIRTRVATEQFVDYHTSFITVFSNIPEELQNVHPDNYNYMINRVSLLMDDFTDQSGTASTDEYPLPYVQKLTLIDGPTFPNTDLIPTQGYFSAAIIRVDSGLRN